VEEGEQEIMLKIAEFYGDRSHKAMLHLMSWLSPVLHTHDLAAVVTFCFTTRIVFTQ